MRKYIDIDGVTYRQVNEDMYIDKAESARGYKGGRTKKIDVTSKVPLILRKLGAKKLERNIQDFMKSSQIDFLGSKVNPRTDRVFDLNLTYTPNTSNVQYVVYLPDRTSFEDYWVSPPIYDDSSYTLQVKFVEDISSYRQEDAEDVLDRYHFKYRKWTR